MQPAPASFPDRWVSRVHNARGPGDWRGSHFGWRRGLRQLTALQSYLTALIERRVAASAERTVEIAQAKDREAIYEINTTAKVRSVESPFVGRVACNITHGLPSQDDTQVTAVVRLVCAAFARHRRSAGAFLARFRKAKRGAPGGARPFLLGTGDGFLRRDATSLPCAAPS